MEVDRSKIKEQDLYEFVSNLAPDLFQNGHVIAVQLLTLHNFQ